MAEEIRTQPRAAPAPPPLDDRTLLSRAGGPTNGEPSLRELFRTLAEDSATLVRQEMALAKAEMTANAKAVARDSAMVAVGGSIAVIGALVLVAFLVLVAGELLGEYWAGALVVGLLFLIVGGVLAMKFLNNLKHESIAPERTVQTLQEDKQWAQNEVQRVRRDLA